MDLETFLTTLYVYVDDWYKAEIEAHIKKHAGAQVQLSDSEVLTIALAGQWRAGVPWRSERGLVRWMQAHGRGMFPGMLGRSAFNARVRWLWGAFIYLQQTVARLFASTQTLYECVDCLGLPAYSSGQQARERGHWLWESTTGVGGTSGGYYVGDSLFVSVLPQGVITGWLTASANVDDRWLLTAFLSTRAGVPGLREPPPATHAARRERPSIPVSHIGPCQAVGDWTTHVYVADRGFNSRRWRALWLDQYQADVITQPPSRDPELRRWSHADRRRLASQRQVIESTFAQLIDVFGITTLHAHSRWGQYTRLAAKCAAFNIGLFFNRLLARPLFALETLIV